MDIFDIFDAVLYVFSAFFKLTAHKHYLAIVNWKSDDVCAFIRNEGIVVGFEFYFALLDWRYSWF